MDQLMEKSKWLFMYWTNNWEGLDDCLLSSPHPQIKGYNIFHPANMAGTVSTCFHQLCTWAGSPKPIPTILMVFDVQRLCISGFDLFDQPHWAAHNCMWWTDEMLSGAFLVELRWLAIFRLACHLPATSTFPLAVYDRCRENSEVITIDQQDSTLWNMNWDLMILD